MKGTIEKTLKNIDVHDYYVVAIPASDMDSLKGFWQPDGMGYIKKVPDPFFECPKDAITMVEEEK